MAINKWGRSRAVPRLKRTHLILVGAKHGTTYCGGGEHNPCFSTRDPGKADCPRCLKSYRAETSGDTRE